LFNRTTQEMPSTDETDRQCVLSRFIADSGIGSYDSLVEKANSDPEWFWSSVISYFGLTFIKPPMRMFAEGDDPQWQRWLPGASLNLAASCIASGIAIRGPSADAVVWESEDNLIRRMSFAELEAETHALAGALRRAGIGKGDRVGILMPMLPETVVAFFAVALIGAVALPLFSGFGPAALAARLADAEAVCVIVVDGTRRRGRTVNLKATADIAAKEVPTLRHMIVLRSLGNDVAMDPGRDVWWDDVRMLRAERSISEVDAEHPLMIVYTSGTTGKPKGTVHTHGGFLLKVAADLGLILDIRSDDRVMWLGDFGWLTGPILATGCMLRGATLTVAEGTPDYPGRGRVWDLIERHAISVFSLSPTLIRAQMRQEVEPTAGRDLSCLRIIVSTGEIWQPEAWRWCDEKVCGRTVPILNYTGGTEVGGTILSCNLLERSKPCSVGKPVPGMGADIAPIEGESQAGDETGELVLRQVSPGLTRGLYKADDVYIATYWSRYPGLWSHGDLVTRDADGQWFVRGRTDDVMKIAGKRTSPSEIEAVVNLTSGVVESAVSSTPDDIKGEALAVFYVGSSEQDLTRAIADAVAGVFGPAFKPKWVLRVSELPRTRSQKVMRGVLRRLAEGSSTIDTSAMENPECVEHLREVIAAAIR